MDVTKEIVTVLNEIERGNMSTDFHNNWTVESFLSKFSHEVMDDGATHVYRGPLSVFGGFHKIDVETVEFLTAIRETAVADYEVVIEHRDYLLSIFVMDTGRASSINGDDEDPVDISFHGGQVLVEVKQSDEEEPVGIIVDIFSKTDDEPGWILQESFTYWYNEVENE
jgi:hypothetical protein